MPETRRCSDCGQTVTRGQPDPCLGRLPGVIYACCGHGDNFGYIAFENGVVVRPYRRGQLTVDDVTFHYEPHDRNLSRGEQGTPRQAYARQGYWNVVDWMLSTAGHPTW